MLFLDWSSRFQHVLTRITGLAKAVATETLDLSQYPSTIRLFDFLTTLPISIMPVDECREKSP
jgi:hypothetical protein